MLLLAASGFVTGFTAHSSAAPRLSGRSGNLVVKTTNFYERPSVQARFSRSLTTRTFSRMPAVMVAEPMAKLTVAGAVAVATIVAIFKVRLQSRRN